MAHALRLLLLAGILLTSVASQADQPLMAPYESDVAFVPANAIDVCVLAAIKDHHITPAPRCSDAVFLRRAFIDVIGTLPTADEAVAFLGSHAENRRARLIDDLLARDEFTDFWTLKWCDILRVKSEFPIKLWPNGVQSYYRWIHDAVRANLPYDRFAQALLTSSGSNFRVPPVNFYRAVQERTPEGRASAVALTFMGTRLERWTPKRRASMAAFFSRVVYKPTAEWKEEVVISDPAPHEPLAAVLPDGSSITIGAEDDPRLAFTHWLLADDNPWFARAAANRVWSWLLGRGVVHPADDLGPEHPPSNPALLACLEKALKDAHYDLKALFRLILNSRTYQASPLPRTVDPRGAALFASYPVRRLDAEVLIDALCRLDGRGENYESQVPEPFTILQGMRRSIRLKDGTITSPFLEMFGRPARDTGLESERSVEGTNAQRLYLLNSSAVNERIARSPWLRQLVKRFRKDQRSLLRELYLSVLSRYPREDEEAIVLTYFRAASGDVREAAADLTWALINTKEFLFRH